MRPPVDRKSAVHRLTRFATTLPSFRGILYRWDVVLIIALTAGALITLGAICTALSLTPYAEFSSSPYFIPVLTLGSFVPIFLIVGVQIVFLSKSVARRKIFLISVPTLVMPLVFLLSVFSSQSGLKELFSNKIGAFLITFSILLVLSFMFWTFVLFARTSPLGQKAASFFGIPYIPFITITCCFGTAVPVGIIIPYWMLYAASDVSFIRPISLENPTLAGLFAVVPFLVCFSIFGSYIYIVSFTKKIHPQHWPQYTWTCRVAAFTIWLIFVIATLLGYAIVISDTKESTGLVLSIVALAIMFPLFSLTGSVLAASRIRIEQKLTLAALLGVQVPLVVCLHLRNVWIDTDFVFIPNIALFSCVLHAFAWSVISILRQRKFTIPQLLYASAVLISCFLFPVGYLCPLLILSKGIQDIEPFAIATSLLLPIAMLAYLAFRFVMFLFRLFQMAQNQQALFSPADTNYWSTWVTRLGLFSSTVCYTLVFFVIPLKDGCGAVILSLFCAAPAFVLLGTALANARGYQKFIVSSLILVLIPLCIFLPVLLYVDMDGLEDVHYVLLTFTIGGPLACVFWFLLWSLHAIFRDEYVFPSSFAFCCWFMFIPFGVLLPIILGITWIHVSVVLISGVIIGIISAVCIFGVSVFSIALNIKFKHIEAERKCRAAIYALQRDLMKINVRSDEEPLIMIYNRFMKCGEIETEEWLDSEQDISTENVDSFLRLVFVNPVLDAQATATENQNATNEDDIEVEKAVYDTGLLDFCCSNDEEKLKSLNTSAQNEIISVSHHIAGQSNSVAQLRWKSAFKVLKKNMEGVWVLVKSTELRNARDVNNKAALEEIYKYYATLDRALGLDDIKFRFLFANARLSRDEYWAFCRDCKLLDHLPSDTLEFIFSQQATYVKMRSMINHTDQPNEVYSPHSGIQANVNRSELTFPFFIEVLQIVAETIYPYEDPEDAYEKFLKDHVLHHIPRIIGPRWDSTKPRLSLSVHNLVKRAGIRFRRKSNLKNFSYFQPDCCSDFMDNMIRMWKPIPVQKPPEVVYPGETQRMIGLPDSWYVVSNTIIESLRRNINRFDHVDIKLNISNPSNLFAVGLLVIEFLSLMSVALHISKPPLWGFEKGISKIYNFFLINVFHSDQSNTQDDSNDGNSSSNSGFLVAVAVAFVLAILFPPFSFPGIRQAQDGTLGKTKDGKLPSVFSMAFAYLKCLNMLGSTLYTVIMKTLISTTSCTLINQVLPSGERHRILVLDGNSSIECWTKEHIPYVVIGALGILFYYPVSTFLYPNLQFQDQALDIKFDPTFVVIFAQANLIMAGSAAYFTEYPNIMLSLCTVIYSGMGYINHKMKPCLVGSINRWHTIILGMTSFSSLCSLMVHNGIPLLPMYIVLTLGWLTAFIYIYWDRRELFARADPKDKVDDASPWSKSNRSLHPRVVAVSMRKLPDTVTSFHSSV